MTIENKIAELRCGKCNSLLCKCSMESTVEIKCKKCKWFSLLKNGEIFNSIGKFI